MKRLALLVTLLMCPVYLLAQDPPPPTQAELEKTLNPWGSGIGVALSVSNNGLGLGGYYRKALSSTTSFFAEFSLTSGNSGNEQQRSTYYGDQVSLNKAYYLTMIPINVGIQKRIFADSITDNLRPFFQVSGGPVFGWSSPYFEDLNQNQIWDFVFEPRRDYFSSFTDGSPHFGVGGSISIGANFGLGKKVTQGVRLSYTFQYFFEDIQLLQPGITNIQQQGNGVSFTLLEPERQRFFGTPTITLIIGKVW